MFLGPKGTRDAQKSGPYWRLLAVPALVMFMAACNTNKAPPPAAEALTHAEFMEFATGFEVDLTAAMDDLTPMVALELAFNAAANATLSGPEVDGIHMLPRGEWEPVLDEWGGIYDWNRVGDLPGPGELQFTAGVEIYDYETEDPDFHDVDYAIDWQADGVATTTVEQYGDTIEFPRSVSVSLHAEQGNIADFRAQLEPKSIAYECADDLGSWSGDMILVSSLLLDGTVGVASEVLLRAIDVGFEVNEAGTNATTAGEINVEYATHVIGATWDASLTTDSDMWGGYEEIWLCHTADMEGLNPELDLNLLLSLNDTEIGIVLQAGTVDGESISVDLAMEVDSAPALTISGLIDAVADEPLNNLVVKFSDEEQSFTEFMESMAPIFGEDL